MAWIRVARETLSQVENGVDYSTCRDVVLRKDQVSLVKTRGHVGWSGVGMTSYETPSWMIRIDGEKYPTNLRGHQDSGRVTADLWGQWLPRIAKAMGLTVDQLPQKVPRGGTFVWVDEDQQS